MVSSAAGLSGQCLNANKVTESTNQSVMESLFSSSSEENCTFNLQFFPQIYVIAFTGVCNVSFLLNKNCKHARYTSSHF